MTGLKIGIHGSSGKMGREIACAIESEVDFILTYKYSRESGDLDALCETSDVIIDFSAPEASISLLPVALKHKKHLLIGTTGFSSEQLDTIIASSKVIPIILAPNTSLGVNALSILVEKAAIILRDYDCDILDIHHASKKDAPSGTALMLGQNIASARRALFIPHDHTKGQKPEGAIGFSAIRAGQVSAENHVIFTDDSESLTFSHKAFNRRVFADGALKAAMWLSGQGSGLYSMRDVLGC